MTTLFEGVFLFYSYQPALTFIKAINAFAEVTQIKGQVFSSLSSNLTHFLTITEKQQIIIYNWKNSIIQQIGNTIQLPGQYKCFNSIFLLNMNAYLLDCYTSKSFVLLKMIDNQFTEIYQVTSQIPITTTLQKYIVDSLNYTLYAQHFKTYSVLTLFSSEFKNQTCWEDKFVDFDVSFQGNNFIYVLTSSIVYQIIISQQQQFEFIANYTEKLIHYEYNIFSVYYNYEQTAQCDIIIIEYQYFNKQLQIRLFAQQGLFIRESYNYLKDKQQVKYIIFNNQFLLQQSSNNITIYEVLSSQPLYIQNISNTTQLYFNSFTNEVFLFDLKIIVYKIQLPKLQINVRNSLDYQQISEIQIFAQFRNFKLAKKCISNLKIQILQKNDTNIYLIKNTHPTLYQGTTGASFYNEVIGFSGQLLEIKTNYDNQYFGQFQEVTFFNIYNLPQQEIQFAQMINPSFYSSKFVYLATYNYPNLTSYVCKWFQLIDGFVYNCTIAYQLDISQNISSLQIAYNLQSPLIVGISYNNTITIFLLNSDNSTNQYNIIINQSISQFLLTFNSVIILIENEEIQIISYNQTNRIIINQELINQLFKNKYQISFNPIQIMINTQYISSILIINNINSIILLAINLNSYLIPINFLHFNFSIYQINQIKTYVILSYICNNTTQLCFEIWDFLNVWNPYRQKNFPSVNFDSQIRVQSDNLFFYVQLQNKTVFVYNPEVPEQMSLHYKFEINGKQFCSIQKSFYSLIFNVNSFYQLFPIKVMKFQLNQSILVEKQYPELIYNFTVITPFNNTAMQSMINQSIIFISNFTQLNSSNFKTYYLNFTNINKIKRTFTIPISLFTEKQIIRCNFYNGSNSSLQNQYENNQNCHLTNTSKQKALININNYTLVTAVNNQFYVLQNNINIMISNWLIESTSIKYFDYSYLNFSECIKTTSTYYQLNSICKNSSNQYWLTIILDNQGNVYFMECTIFPIVFQTIYKMVQFQNYLFISGSQQNQSSLLYIFFIVNNIVIKNMNNSLYQNYSIQQYDVAQFKDQPNNNYNVFAVIFIAENMPLYSIITFNENIILSINCNYLFIDVFNQKISVINNQLNQIFIVEVKSNQIKLLFVCNSFASIFLSLSYNKQLASISIKEILATISTYGQLQITQNIIYQEGILMQQFQLPNQSYVLGVYNLSQIQFDNLDTPILMFEGQSNISMPSYSMIINKLYFNGTFVTFINNSIFIQPIITQLLTCPFIKKKKHFNVSIFCYNDFSFGNYEVTFLIPNLDEHKESWFYSLFLIICFLLIGSCYFVKSKIKGKKFYIEIEL
ncbi:unnamed protein product [Paramecium sonneborni]|uniref:Transmembrane protein n=1 Tax=Paramecium sonneborni TaxID=65129 RepID=A0A8S1PBD2_9CILI|nr:unnamed protein product [Paramecium sonneborni]